MPEEVMEILGASLVANIGSMIFSIAVYVLSSLAFYTIAKRRGINHAWLSWIPVGNAWILGSLSDQYRYVTKGQVKSKRKILLILEIILSCIMILCFIFFGVAMANVLMAMGTAEEEEAAMRALAPMMGAFFMFLPLLGVAIAHTVITYMALYDVYMSMDPENAVMYLVLSILFGVTQPFFLFFNRKKDRGMGVPQNAIPEPPVYQPPQQPWDNQQPPQQPWDNQQPPQQPSQEPWNNQ